MAIDIRKLNHTQLNDLIQRAESRKSELNKERVAKVREKVIAFAKAEGFTFDDLFGSRVRKTRRGAKAKFRNPADHAQTWSGRGKRPRWLVAAVKSGRKIEEFRISDAAPKARQRA